MLPTSSIHKDYSLSDLDSFQTGKKNYMKLGEFYTMELIAADLICTDAFLFKSTIYFFIY